MAREIGIHIKAYDMYSKEMDNLEKSLNKTLEKTLTFGNIAKTAAIATAAIGAELVIAAKAASEAEAAENRLTVALGHRSQALLDQADALKRKTAFDDDDIVGAQARIAMYVKDESQIAAVTQATMDLAAAQGIGLNEAADKVARTLGTQTNGLAKMGIEVNGATGSTERLNSVLVGLNSRFGGQAEAELNTFGGRIKQLGVSFGGLQEAIGRTIIQNPVVIQAVGMISDLFGNMADNIEKNQVGIQQFVKGGIIGFVQAMGVAVEALRIFHNGWIGIRIIGQGAVIAIVESLNFLFKALRFVLLPFDLLAQGLVKMGALKVNPFDGMQQTMDNIKLGAHDVMGNLWKEADDVNQQYDKWSMGLAVAANALDSIDAKQISVLQNSKSINAEGGPGGGGGKPIGLGKSVDEFLGNAPDVIGGPQLTEQEKMQQRLDAINDFYVKKWQLAVAHNASAAELEDINNRWLIDAERQTALLRAQAAKEGLDAKAAIVGEGAAASIDAMQQEYAMTQNIGGAMIAGLGAYAKQVGVIKAAEHGAEAIGEGAKAIGSLASFDFWGAFQHGAAAVKHVAAASAYAGMGGGGGGGGAAPSGGGMPSLPARTASPNVPTMPSQPEQKRTQDVTVIIQNPLSTQNWQKIAEDNIVPALNAAKDRNINMTFVAG